VRIGAGPFSLTSSYQMHARQIAEAQIAVAGARLAAVLNRDLGAPALRGTH
jgi:hypothetical protein